MKQKFRELLEDILPEDDEYWTYNAEDGFEWEDSPYLDRSAEKK